MRLSLKSGSLSKVTQLPSTRSGARVSACFQSSHLLCCGFRNEEEVINKNKHSSCKLSGTHHGPGPVNILQVFLIHMLQMRKLRLRLNPGVKVDGRAAVEAAG